ncbi:hypothetical protein B0H14DRAFT_2636240 [Mycena olivaceomarginata]|nr:hypothetical protein B0H14DRAFT_2636240 [Mycena olivaceomarginata]
MPSHAYWADGAAAVVDAGALHLCDRLLVSTSVFMHNWTVSLKNLVHHPGLSYTVFMILAGKCPVAVLMVSRAATDEIQGVQGVQSPAVVHPKDNTVSSARFGAPPTWQRELSDHFSAKLMPSHVNQSLFVRSPDSDNTEYITSRYPYASWESG